MAYNTKKLAMQNGGVIGQLNVFNYVAPDDGDDDVFADIIAADYISDAEDHGMRVGDIVYVQDTSGGTAIVQCTVISATGGATLAALSALA